LVLKPDGQAVGGDVVLEVSRKFHYFGDCVGDAVEF
jgi:hypothetical protein